MLRDYQIAAVRDLQESARNKVNTLIQLPTGTGKTTIIAQYLNEWRKNNHNSRVLVVAHRVELIDQITERLNQFGVIAGKILSTEPLNESFQVQVGLIQSLRNNKRKPISLGLIMIDEAHHINAQSYSDLINYYNLYNPVVFGFTATPARLDGRSLGDVFTKLCEYGQISDFIKNGYLSQLKHYATGFPDLKVIRIKTTGDYDEKKLEEEMGKEKIMADLIKGYEMHAKNKKMIVFAVNSEHAINICKRYNEKGYSAVSLDYKTPADIRKKNVEDFKIGKIRILVNVNLFTEGFDCPDVEVVQLARPTKSLNLYLQMVGRGMRISTGKDFGIILDNAMLWEEHGLSTRNREWSLSGLAKSNVKFVVTEKVNVSNETEKESKIPAESTSYELVEIVQNDIIKTQDQTISLLALPITLNELVEYLNFSGNMNLNQRILNETLSNSKFHHYLLNRDFTLFDILEILGIELNKNQKSYSVKIIIKDIRDYINDSKDINIWNKRHYSYLRVCYWSSFEFFKVRNIAIKLEALMEMKQTDIKKAFEFFSNEKVFDDLFVEKDILSKGLEEMDIQFIHQLKEKIAEKYAEKINNKLKYILQ